jgi:cGMP-dependent protein kinase
MGLCASTNDSVLGPGSKHAHSSLSRRTKFDAANVTEKAVENILKAHRRKVVHDNEVLDDNFQFPVVQKSAENRRFLTTALKEHFFIFSDFDPMLQARLIDAMEKKSLDLREVIMNQGDEGDFMYVVEKGVLEVIVDGVKVKSIKPGMVVGELALLYQAPRAATVRCVSTPCQAWKVGRRTLANITRTMQSKQASDYTKRLSEVKLLEGLTSRQRQRVADVLVPMHFKQGAKIINQGDDGEAFYIIDSGSVACVDRNGGTSDLILGPGQYFGELALLKDEKRKRDVVARADTQCLILGRSDFNLLLGGLKLLMDRNVGLRVLQTVEIFKTLSPGLRQELVESFRERIFKTGEMVIEENAVGDSFFVIREGKANVLKNGKTVSSLVEGQFFGEGSLLDGSPRSATITAASKSLRVFELKKKDFDSLLGPIRKMIAKTAEERRELMALKSVTLQEVLKGTGRILGQGTFGLVKLVNVGKGKTKGVFALKCLKKKQIVAYNLAKNILYEKRMMVESDHPFVLKLVNTYQDPNNLYMLLEIVPGGELFAFLQKRGGFVSTKHAQFITACVVSVFEYIHAKNICYRDLKPENLMIDAIGYIKMVDFGFAKVVTDKTFTLCGTPEYMAPEILLRRGHNKGVDYWATGILIYECESGTTPFADYEGYDNKVICENILRKPLTFPNKMNPAAKLVIRKLLHRQPNKRLGCLARGARDIKAEAYYSTLDWQKLLNKELRAPHVPAKKSKNGISEDAFETINVADAEEIYKGDQGVFKDFSS